MESLIESSLVYTKSIIQCEAIEERRKISDDHKSIHIDLCIKRKILLEWIWLWKAWNFFYFLFLIAHQSAAATTTYHPIEYIIIYIPDVSLKPHFKIHSVKGILRDSFDSHSSNWLPGKVIAYSREEKGKKEIYIEANLTVPSIRFLSFS